MKWPTKERLEVFALEKMLQMDTFKVLKGHGWKGFSQINPWSQDKGHGAGVAAFVRAIEQGLTIPFEEIAEATRTSIELGKKTQRLHEPNPMGIFPLVHARRGPDGDVADSRSIERNAGPR